MAELVYKYTAPEGKITRHMWTIVGPNGAVHVWAEPTNEWMRERWGEHYYGGIEIHSPKPFYYSDDNPHHNDCWLLNGPCWHDGSSLQFSEQIEPHLKRCALPFHDGIHEYVNSILHDWYQSRFRAEEV